MMNDQDRFKRVEAIFRSAVKLDAEARMALLDAECGDDVALRDDVRKLLDEDAKDPSLLDRPALGRTMDLSRLRNSGRTPEPPLPEMISHYRIIRLLGQGGMGIVYEAEQDSPQRIVALKVINAGVTSERLLRRFEHEAQILGKLQHPGIAQIFEAGTFDAGAGEQPFFAMELIDGESLTNYVENNQLSTRQRLELMTKICDAVEHAHQRGVIHRDLKPGNILVDASGQPKILDFGVARATNADVQTITLQTDIGQLLGTVPYMSPEQATGDPAELDTRSDVYALGVVAYELLTGRMPYDLREKMIHEAVRVIREEEPAPLSSIDRTLRGDVEIFIHKALAKEPARRYQSASEFAGDIGRYLRDEPIVARPPSTWYQLSKFAKRNTALVGGVAGIILALSLGVVFTGLALARALDAEAKLQDQLTETGRQADIARENEQRAEQRAAETAAVNTFLIEDLLGQARPEVNPVADDITVRALLDRSAEKIEVSFEQQPEVEIVIRQTIADAYFALGLYGDAESHWQRAVDLLADLEGDNDPDTLAAMDQLAMTIDYMGRSQDAESMYRRILKGWREQRGDGAPETMLTVNNLAEAIRSQGRHNEAQRLHEQNLEKRRAVLGPDHPDTLETMNNLAAIYFMLSDLERSETMFQETWEGRRSALGDDHPLTLITMSNLAVVKKNLGKLAEAEPLLRRSLEADRRIQGAEHPDTLTDMHNLGLLLLAQQKCDEAAPLMSETLALRQRILGEVHPRTLSTTQGLIDALQCLGSTADARALLVDLIGLRRHIADEPKATPRERHNVAILLLTCEPDDLRDAGGALAYAEDACAQTDYENVRYLLTLALAFDETGQRAEAIRWQTRAIELTAEDDPDRTEMQQRLEQYKAHD